MIVQHALQLLRYYRRLVIAIVLIATVGAAAVSVLRLVTSPVYTATASVAVLPTEAEYAFGRESGGPAAAAKALTATYMEYLRSRPVVETAIDRIAEATGEQPPSEPSALSRMLTIAKGYARRTYRLLDSGMYVPSTERSRDVKKLMDAIELFKVADSYILRIQVNLSDPVGAAAAANALAEAYVDRVSDQLAVSAGQIGGFLKQQITEREEELSSLLAEEEKLKKGLGISSVDEERKHLLAERDQARQKLLDAQAEVSSALAAVQELDAVNIAQSGRSLSELSQERSAAAARLEGAERSATLRRTTIDHVNRSLSALRDKEEPLLAVYRQMELTKTELTELQSRMLTTNLTRSSAMAQVRVVEPAAVPSYPSSPRVVKNTAAAGIAGALLALFAVFLIDTVSGTVKTTADLERMVGTRSLSAMSVSSVTNATSPRRALRNGRLSQLKSLGAELERGLTVLRAFEASTIQVTGFLAPLRLCDTALAIGTALASQHRRVECALPDPMGKGETTRTIVEGQLRARKSKPDSKATTEADADDKADSGPAPYWSTNGRQRPIRIKCLQPVSADLHLSDAANRSPVLVCVIPAGQVLERDVEEFYQRASGAGLSALCFILLNP